MSTHEVKVIQVDEVGEHDNADSLEVIRIGGYTCCVRKGQFHAGDLAAYIEPDTLVPVAEPEFAFLADKAKEGMVRIKAVKLRGKVSFGLLIPAREGWAVGSNVMEELGCVHYEPPIRGMSAGGDNTSAPNVYHTKYDVESYRNYPTVLKCDEPVAITEKIHGANARYVFHDGKLHCSSHTSWKLEDDQNLWWWAAREYGLAEKLAKYPDYVFYGEVFGRVQDLKYGSKNEDPPQLAFFDILYEGNWLKYEDMGHILVELGLPSTPWLYIGGWEDKLAEEYSNGETHIGEATHTREGCVIRPLEERWDESIGRVLLKVVGSDYLTRKK